MSRGLKALVISVARKSWNNQPTSMIRDKEVTTRALSLVFYRSRKNENAVAAVIDMDDFNRASPLRCRTSNDGKTVKHCIRRISTRYGGDELFDLQNIKKKIFSINRFRSRVTSMLQTQPGFKASCHTRYLKEMAEHGSAGR